MGSVGPLLACVAGLFVFAALGVAAGDYLPMRAVSAAGMMASFLAVVFGQLIYLDRLAGAARLRQGLLMLVGFGILVLVGGLIGGAETAVRFGGRVAFFGVVLAMLRLDYVIARLLVGRRVVNVAAAFLAASLVLEEVAVSYPGPALRTAIFVVRLTGVAVVAIGFCHAAWIALRRASGRTT
jgi:hypothetical protein